jgi:hypothetical protein
MIIVGTPHTKGAGYYINDKNLRTRQEADIRTCTHCQQIIKMQEWKKAGAWCPKCFAPICSGCGKRMLTFGCEPFIRTIEKVAEERMRFKRFMKDAGLDEPVTPQQILTGSQMKE